MQLFSRAQDTITLHCCTRLLQTSIGHRYLEGGRQVLALIIGKHGTLCPLLASRLIRLFTLCGSSADANHLFAAVSVPNSFPLPAHSQPGQANATTYQRLLHSDIPPTAHVFVAAIKACSSSLSLEQGKLLHGYIVESACESNLFVGSTLIDMYSKCKSLPDASRVFDRLPEQNLVTWTAMIAGHAQQGHALACLKLLCQMQQCGFKPTHVAYVCVLKACSIGKAIYQGRLIHSLIMEMDLQGHTLIENTLIDMYAKCGSLEDARNVFDASPSQGVVKWSVMIAGYAESGVGQEAFILFQQMLQEGSEPPDVVLISVLKACSSMQALGEGKRFHAYIVASGCGVDGHVGNSLVDMYFKCGNIEFARRTFLKLPKHDVVTWSTLIAGYAAQGEADAAIYLFQKILWDGIEPDSKTYGSILKACSGTDSLHMGRLIHAHIIQRCGELELFIGNCLIDMYVKCGSLKDACQVFDQLSTKDVVSWSIIIGGYSEIGDVEMAHFLLKDMQVSRLKPDNVTLACMLKACSNFPALDEGKNVHKLAVQDKGEQNLFIGNSLIELYINSGRIEDALEVFHRLPKHHIITWSTLIARLVQQGCYQVSLDLFQQMRQEGMEANSAVYACILKACSNSAALEQGKLVHSQIKQHICEMDCFLSSTLIDMYAKCGRLTSARQVFDALAKHDVVVWSAIIGGYAESSNYEVALEYFRAMQEEGEKPNEVTFISLLCACSHRGLLNEGCHHFHSMSEVHGIGPTSDHYTCMVDLFGRAGLLHESVDILQTMPFKPDLIAWMSLLSNCRIHGNTNLGRRSFQSLLRINVSHASCYELMSKLYADDGEFDCAAGVQEQRKYTHAWKRVGKALIEVNNKVHEFLVDSRDYRQSPSSNGLVLRTILQLRVKGYVPLIGSVLHYLFDTDWDVEATEDLAVCIS